jgi:hypothetical protein
MMACGMADKGPHPDLFTAEEAIEYLHLPPPPTGLRVLETLRYEKGLIGRRITRKYHYHRRDLDDFIQKVWGLKPPARSLGQ